MTVIMIRFHLSFPNFSVSPRENEPRNRSWALVFLFSFLFPEFYYPQVMNVISFSLSHHLYTNFLSSHRLSFYFLVIISSIILGMSCCNVHNPALESHNLRSIPSLTRVSPSVSWNSSSISWDYNSNFLWHQRSGLPARIIWVWRWADMEVPKQSFNKSSWDSRTCYPRRAFNQGLTNNIIIWIWSVVPKDLPLNRDRTRAWMKEVSRQALQCYHFQFSIL